MTDSEKIRFLERENQLLKDKIDLLEELQRLKDRNKIIEYEPFTNPWTTTPNDPWIPTITYTNSDTVHTIYANKKTGDA